MGRVYLFNLERNMPRLLFYPFTSPVCDVVLIQSCHFVFLFFLQGGDPRVTICGLGNRAIWMTEGRDHPHPLGIIQIVSLLGTQVTGKWMIEEARMTGLAYCLSRSLSLISISNE